METKFSLKKDIGARILYLLFYEAIEVSDDDIIHLNVGGQKFTTTLHCVRLKDLYLPQCLTEGGKIA